MRNADARTGLGRLDGTAFLCDAFDVTLYPPNFSTERIQINLVLLSSLSNFHPAIPE